MRKATLSKSGGLMAIVVLALSQAPEATPALPSTVKPGAARVYDVEKAGSEIRFHVKSRLKTIEGCLRTGKPRSTWIPLTWKPCSSEYSHNL